MSDKKTIDHTGEIVYSPQVLQHGYQPTGNVNGGYQPNKLITTQPPNTDTNAQPPKTK